MKIGEVEKKVPHPQFHPDFSEGVFVTIQQ
jgi:hypothetical protein